MHSTEYRLQMGSRYTRDDGDQSRRFTAVTGAGRAPTATRDCGALALALAFRDCDPMAGTERCAGFLLPAHFWGRLSEPIHQGERRSTCSHRWTAQPRYPIGQTSKERLHPAWDEAMTAVSTPCSARQPRTPLSDQLSAAEPGIHLPPAHAVNRRGR